MQKNLKIKNILLLSHQLCNDMHYLINKLNVKLRESAFDSKYKYF